MKKVERILLKTVRKVYTKGFGKPKKPEFIQDPDEAAEAIYNALAGEEPRMIARFGANELSVLVNYLGVKKNDKKSALAYVLGNAPSWWWEEGIINLLHSGAGFFPPEKKKIEQFCELMLKEISQVDILGSWLCAGKDF